MPKEIYSHAVNFLFYATLQTYLAKVDRTEVKLQSQK